MTDDTPLRHPNPANLDVDTQLVVAGREPSDYFGFVNPPVYRGSTVLYPDVATMKARSQPYTYGRRGTPTTKALEIAIDTLEGSAGTVLTPSGLNAIATALLSCTRAGDHVLVSDSVYQPTRNFCNGVLTRFGVEIEYYDPLIGAGIAALIRDNTSVVYTESPGSQTFEMQDIPAIAKVAHAAGALVLMDNTWATALNYRPLDFGVDMSIQAGTKYIVGHSDVMMGAVSATEASWPKLIEFHGASGLCLGPDDVYLASRGLRTMRVRLDRHQASAIEMARWLEQRPEVSRVLHPALESHPQHAIFKRDFKGSSGLFSIILKDVPEAARDAFLDAVTLFGKGYSWGGFESLVIPFDCSSYRTATAFEAEGPALRFHIGLEDTDDLKGDLDQAFAAMTAAA